MRNLLEEVCHYSGDGYEIRLNKKGVTASDGVVVRIFYALLILIFNLGFNQPTFANATKNSLERGGVIAINQRSEVIVTNDEAGNNAALYHLNVRSEVGPDLISDKIVFFSSISKYGDLVPYIPATEETDYTGDSTVGLNEREQRQYFVNKITHIAITFLFFMLLGWFFGGGYNTIANELYAIDRVILRRMFW
ncbi:hypothetical protein [uncultured Tolumonas sp.]|uniref:hypothetical protein n=1 Tax=uncultured Tolumonas sp. TaxID=263765 RepID=UPI002A0A956A|nr:hypothetical protein [uncultured Tolumonas sp.]